MQQVRAARHIRVPGMQQCQMCGKSCQKLTEFGLQALSASWRSHKRVGCER
jgi:hypothetical protein